MSTITLKRNKKNFHEKGILNKKLHLDSYKIEPYLTFTSLMNASIFAKNAYIQCDQARI